MISEPATIHAEQVRVDGQELLGYLELTLRTEVEPGKTTVWPPGATGNDIRQSWRSMDKMKCWRLTGLPPHFRDRGSIRLELWARYYQDDEVGWIYWQFPSLKAGQRQWLSVEAMPAPEDPWTPGTFVDDFMEETHGFFLKTENGPPT